MTAAAFDSEDLVQQFCAVTGSDEVTGLYLLEACGGDLEMAIGMHIDGSGSNLQQGRQRELVSENRMSDIPGPSTSSAPDDGGVRAPIPQKQEILVEDSFAIVAGSRQNRRRKINSVFDGFRDFQAEARQQSLIVNGDPLAVKRRTLEDLFRPPIDLLHKGSFRSSCEAGKACNRWLLVNVQNVQEFSCQTLNRDVWSNAAVKELIREHFLLWQVYSDSEEGRKYMQFYHVNSWPYVAVLDPRTGENMLSMNRLDANTFCEIMSDFLASHSVPDQTFEAGPPLKRSKVDTLVDTSEDDQLQAAIAASLGENGRGKAPQRGRVPLVGGRTHSNGKGTSSSEDSYSESSEDDLETFSDDDSQAATLPSESAATVGSCSDKESTKRLQDGKACNDSSKLAKLNFENPEVAALDSCSSNSSSSLGPHSTDSEDLKSEEVSWESYCGSSSDPASSIVFRFPDGVRKTLSLPCSSRLKLTDDGFPLLTKRGNKIRIGLFLVTNALVCYIDKEGYSSRHFELVTTFPRRKLSTLDQDSTLVDNGLHPQETIFVQEI